MKPIQYYPYDILKHVYGLVKESVCDNVYPEERPRASTDKIDEMVIVSIPYIMRNHNVVQTSALRFEIVVRNKQNGVVNVEKLQTLLDKITSILPIKTDRFFINDPYLALRGEDKVGFTVWQVQAKLTVYTLDRYE